MRKGENLGQQFLQAKKLRFREVVIWHLGSHSQWQPKQNLNQKLEIQDVISLCHPAFVSRHMGNISYLHIILLFGTLLFFLGLLSFPIYKIKVVLNCITCTISLDFGNTGIKLYRKSVHRFQIPLFPRLESKQITMFCPHPIFSAAQFSVWLRDLFRVKIKSNSLKQSPFQPLVKRIISKNPSLSRLQTQGKTILALSQ